MQQCMICHVADTLVSPHHTYTYRTIGANTAHTVSESKVHLSVGNCMALNTFCVLIKGTQMITIACKTVECDCTKCVCVLLCKNDRKRMFGINAK